MALLRNFAAFVTADNTRVIAGTCWVLGHPETPRHRIVFEPGDPRDVEAITGVRGYILLQDGTTHAGLLLARDDATLLLAQE